MGKQSYLKANTKPYPPTSVDMKELVCDGKHGMISVKATYKIDSGISSLTGICSDGTTTTHLGDPERKDGEEKTASCPTGQVVMGLRSIYRKARFESLSIICASPNSGYIAEKDSSMSLRAFGKNTSLELRCPDKYFGIGITGTSTKGVSSLGLICADYQSGASALSTPKELGTVHNNSSQYHCPYGQFMNGISGNGLLQVEGIKGTCYGGSHTSTLGEIGVPFGNFRVTCKAGQGVVGFEVNKGIYAGIADLSVVCKDPPQVPYKAASPSPVPVPSEPETTGEIIAETQAVAKEVINAGYVGIVRVHASKATCNLTAPITLDFHMVESISESLLLNTKISNTTRNAKARRDKHTHAELARICGDLPVSTSIDGCVWRTSVLLGVLYEQGLYRTYPDIDGASPSISIRGNSEL